MRRDKWAWLGVSRTLAELGPQWSGAKIWSTEIKELKLDSYGNTKRSLKLGSAIRWESDLWEKNLQNGLKWSWLMGVFWFFIWRKTITGGELPHFRHLGLSQITKQTRNKLWVRAENKNQKPKNNWIDQQGVKMLKLLGTKYIRILYELKEKTIIN